MSFRHIVTEILLWAGVFLILCATVGVIAARSAYDRLHFPAVASLGALLVSIAVVVEKSFSLVGDESLLIGVSLVIAAPVLTHATGRAIRISERGDWRAQDGEEIKVEEKDA